LEFQGLFLKKRGGSFMSDKEKSIMAEVERQYGNYGVRTRELCAEGAKAIGYICSFVPLEFITAAGCIPFRIRGDIREPITRGDSLLETIVCPFVRSCFDLCVKDRYDFLSGIVIPHGCDSMVRSYSVWSYSLNFPYFHFVNTPTVVKESSHEFFKEELRSYQKSLEDFTGKAITAEDLQKAVRLHNDNRLKTKALYEFRKADPPLVSAAELHKILTVGASLPVAEANALLDEVLAELGRRTEHRSKKAPGSSWTAPVWTIPPLPTLSPKAAVKWWLTQPAWERGTCGPLPTKTAIPWPHWRAATWTGSIAPRPTGKTQREPSPVMQRRASATSGRGQRSLP